MRLVLMLCAVMIFASSFALGQESGLSSDGKVNKDVRLGDLRTLNSYFPFQSIEDWKAWPERRDEIRTRILVSQGLWPMPTKTDLGAVVHGRVKRDGYTVDRVFFESYPGHFVTGSLYRPDGKQGPFPVILSPHGHWSNGRFYQAPDPQARKALADGAERFENAARFPIQARAVQLARMGCMVFIYDMTGNADSIQLGHRPDRWQHLDKAKDWGYFSAQAELRLQNMMGLQTWNSIRARDFLSELPDVDTERIGVTGASGGGTQSMIIGAVDDRIAAAMPCVMVSTAMQGGCTCENAPYMRIDQGNIDIAAAIAPRPLGLTAADDWTVELRTKGFPDLVNLYEKSGHRARLTAAFNTHFKHNYNHVNRAVMYDFFNRHFALGFDSPVLESDFVPLTQAEASVWTDKYPAPSGAAVGDSHEVALLKTVTGNSDETLDAIRTKNKDEFKNVVTKAWDVIIGRRISDVGPVAFQDVHQSTSGEITIKTGLISHAAAGELVPILVATKKDEAVNGVAIWLTDTGKSGVLENGQLGKTGRAILESGSALVAVDLFGQGRPVSDQEEAGKQRHWFQRKGENGWEKFSGYTYGYNHTMFARRVHDALSVIKYASSLGSKITVVGDGRESGPVAVATIAQADGQISRILERSDGFSFASVTDQFDAMFVPGAVKYGDLATLRGLFKDSIAAFKDQTALIKLTGLSKTSVAK